jgi:hypothetical protein
MSSKSVRDDLRQAWVTLIGDVPYYDTINTTPGTNAKPDTWITMLFDGERERITLGSPACYREIGTVGIVIMHRAGLGDSASGVLADRILNHFSGYSGAGGQMIIIGVQPPKDVINDSPLKSEFYKTLVELDYTYDTYQ